jgi:hypothetical protein
MSSPSLPAPPESRGPGTEAPGGAVVYGVRAPAGHTLVPPPRPSAEREADRAARAADARCRHCAGIPDEILLPLAQALRSARSEGRPLP